MADVRGFKKPLPRGGDVDAMKENGKTPQASGDAGTCGARESGMPSAPPMYDIFVKFQDNADQDNVGMDAVLGEKLRIGNPGKVRSLLDALRADGETVCATRTREVAETKMAELNAGFRSADCPLYCTIRKSEHYGV